MNAAEEYAQRLREAWDHFDRATDLVYQLGDMEAENMKTQIGPFTTNDAGRFRTWITGTCMQPSYPDGSLIEFQVVPPNRLEVNRDYLWFRTDGMNTFKRLVAIDGDVLTLAGINQHEHPGNLTVSIRELSVVARAVCLVTPAACEAQDFGRARP
jgi:phage repressor protein C with HTH and peptisase S24 domain